MKKLILALVLSAFAFSSFAAQANMQATVISTKGKAEMQSAGTWVALKPGDNIEQGTVIQTGFKSELVLKIKESTVTVAPLSRLTLQTLAERQGIKGSIGKDETTIKLATGSIKSNVQKTADRRVGFTVRSPVATASVRGTEFVFTTKFRGTALSTTAGIVAFWKNTKQSERVLDAILKAIEEAPAEETAVETTTEETSVAEGTKEEGGATEEKLGNAASDISEFAPTNAITVSQGERASASNNSSNVTTPSQTAQAEAVSVGEGTKTASDVEKPAQTAGTPTTGPKDTTPGFGSAVITIGFES